MISSKLITAFRCAPGFKQRYHKRRNFKEPGTKFEGIEEADIRQQEIELSEILSEV